MSLDVEEIIDQRNLQNYQLLPKKLSIIDEEILTKEIVNRHRRNCHRLGRNRQLSSNKLSIVIKEIVN